MTLLDTSEVTRVFSQKGLIGGSSFNYKKQPSRIYKNGTQQSTSGVVFQMVNCCTAQHSPENLHNIHPNYQLASERGVCLCLTSDQNQGHNYWWVQLISRCVSALLCLTGHHPLEMRRRKWNNEKLPSASQPVHWISASGNVLEERHLW